jgi:hypothetical protein
VTPILSDVTSILSEIVARCQDVHAAANQESVSEFSPGLRCECGEAECVEKEDRGIPSGPAQATSRHFDKHLFLHHRCATQDRFSKQALRDKPNYILGPSPISLHGGQSIVTAGAGN